MGDTRNSYEIPFRILEGENKSEELSVAGRIILKWILGTYCRSCGLNSSGSG
jgi:hypothetical protein